MADQYLNVIEFQNRYDYDYKTDKLLADRHLSVFKAFDKESGKEVVFQKFDGPSIIPDLFLKESEKVLKISHPNLIRHLNFWVIRTENLFGEATFSLVSVHEYAEGQNLRDWMSQDHKGKKHLDSIVTGILEGLAQLHHEGITHGNLIPDNIIIIEKENTAYPVLINFGYSKLFQAKKTSSGNLLLGTGQYLAPEKILSRSDSRLRYNIDLWALGVILFEIMSAQSPFGSKAEGHSLAYIFDQILKADLSSKIQEFKEPFKSIISKCLKRDPEERVQSPLELMEYFKEKKTLPPNPGPQTSFTKLAGNSRNFRRFHSDLGITFSSKEPNKQPSYQHKNLARVIFLGQTNAGKSTLINHLVPSNLERESENKGINISHFNFSHENQEIQINLWEFADDRIVHNTYQFFLSDEAVYVLVLTPETEENDLQVLRWLNLIQAHGEESQIIVVINKADLAPSQLNKSGLMHQFPNISDWLEISSDIEGDMGALSKAIQKNVSKLTHIAQSIPTSWLTIAEQLTAKDAEFIEYSAFRQLALAQNLAPVEQEELTSWLHVQGVMLTFRDEIALQGTGILNPEWITDGVSIIMALPEVEEKLGIIPTAKLAEVLPVDRFPREKHIVLLEIMHKFQFCFPVGEKMEYYLIPSLLPVKKPKYAWRDQGSQTYRFLYTRLPHSMMHRFLVKIHPYTEETFIWRTGVVLSKSETRAEVIFQSNENSIDIRIEGREKEAMLFLLETKLREIQKQYGKISYQKFVPCTCSHCSKVEKPKYYNTNTLEKLIKNKAQSITCDRGYENVNITDLILTKDSSSQQKSTRQINQEPEEEYQNNFSGILAKTELSNKTEKILFLASNPSNTDDLQLTLELKKIGKGLQSAKHRDRFDLEQEWAVTPRDFRLAILNNDPVYVHFSGHGTNQNEIGSGIGARSLTWEDEEETGGLILENDQGKATLVTGESLDRLFKLFDSIKCVLLNACHSRTQAEAISKHIDYVIGMKRPIKDTAAISFAVEFYDAIGAGKEVEFAFEYACAALDSASYDIPVLFKKGVIVSK